MSSSFNVLVFYNTGWFFWLVPPRKFLSMELVPPNRKKWPSTLVPPKTSWVLTQKSSNYGAGLPQQDKMTIDHVYWSHPRHINNKFSSTVVQIIFSCWGVPVPYLELFWVRRSWMGPVYLVIFSCWGGPVPYLELFWVGPVKKTTL